MKTESAQETPNENTRSSHSETWKRTDVLILFVSVFMVAGAGIVYELLAGTLSTYLLGNSVTHFSIVVGLFLSAMGLGSFLSRFVSGRILRTFIVVEIAVGLIGGSLALILFFAFAILKSYKLFLITGSVVVGTLVGLEIPLLVRILKQQGTLKTVLGNVLALDYLGALVASLLFPLVCVPWIGLIRTGFLFGLLNLLVGAIGLHLFGDRLGKTHRLWGAILFSMVLLVTGFATAGGATRFLEDTLYDDDIIFTKTTPYQRIVVTKWRHDIRLYIDGAIQFSTTDEFRYHESLVHPVVSLAGGAPKTVLILGGGDGFAVREVLKYNSVERIDLVDLDPEITQLFKDNPLFVELNKDSLNNDKVHIYNEDAQIFLENSDASFDVVIIDLPDPNNESLGKLYSRSFYRLVAKHLKGGGAFVTQATSPFFAKEAFWCIENTLKHTTLNRFGQSLYTLPYHTNVPSFGEWGFVAAALKPITPDQIHIPVETKYLTKEFVPSLFVFPKDLKRKSSCINRLDNQELVALYEKGFREYH